MSCNHNSHHEHNHSVNEANAKKTLIVIIITIVTMLLEIIYGYYTNSMALLADGWHMGTHAFALTITFAAYILISKLENSPLFPRGTGKISTLAGFVSSIFLGVTGIIVVIESIGRFFNPLKISFDTAILIAIIGVIVNGICLLIMESGNKGTDYNYKAAYLHILTDALTSVFAIIALFAGKFAGLIFLDPIMGLLGGYLILKWSIGLIKDTTIILLDIDLNNSKNHKPDEHNHCFSH
ncbi:MAG: cation diffusion facilitator family transporter [Candidatus Gastranaerophilaceae bacterium]